MTPGHVWFTNAASGAKLLQYVCSHNGRLWREEKYMRAVNFVVINLHALRCAGSAVCLLEVVHQPSGPEFRHIARGDQHAMPGLALWLWPELHASILAQPPHPHQYDSLCSHRYAGTTAAMLDQTVD